MTPREAVRKICISCAGTAYMARGCGGNRCLNGQGDENGICYFYRFRQGKGRPSVKLIRKFCVECMGRSRKLVARCENSECPLHEYRFGKHPKFVGRLPKHLEKHRFVAQKNPESRCFYYKHPRAAAGSTNAKAEEKAQA